MSLGKFFREILGQKEYILYQKETPYNKIVVLNDRDRLKLILDPSYNLHSVLIKKRLLTGSYWDVCAVMALLLLGISDKASTLILGFGGGTISRIIKEIRPEIKVIGVDIDKEVLSVARSLFRSPADHLVVSDFASFMESVKKNFSVIVIDVFHKAMIPHRLFEVPLWSRISERTDVGFVLNTTSIVQAESIQDIACKFFSKVKIIKSPESSNYILFGIKNNSPDLKVAIARSSAHIATISNEKAEKSQISRSDLTDILSTMGYILENIKDL